MTESSRLPIYKNNLPDFLWALRNALDMTQQDIGTHVCLHHSRITRYENPETLDKPRMGYVAELARLIAESNDNDPTVQEALLIEVNKASSQLPGGRLRDWDDLCNVAKRYIDKRQQTKQKDKSTKEEPTQITQEDAVATEPKDLPASLHESTSTYLASLDSDSTDTTQTEPDEAWQDIVQERLESPSSIKLFGIDPHTQRLHHLLLESGTEWIISIEGLGGLGKTTLADHIVRYSVMGKHFKGVAWINAKQQEFLEDIELQRGDRASLDIGTLVDVLLEQLGLTSALALEPRQKRNVLEKQIRGNSYLIVIDNLETLDDIQTLLPYLRKLANPSKILLTSRYNLQAYPEVARVYLNQLNLTDAIHLLRHEARVRGPALLADASDTQLERIYEVVGGNPLALKLVVGQIDALSLPEVLETLTQIEDNEVDELYTHIYQKSWHLLDSTKQALLLMMPLIYNGTVEQLLALTQLERPVLNQALRQLVRLSLIEAGGGLQTRRYQLHRLTETFLLKQTIQWRTLDATDLLDQNQLFRSGILRNLTYWQDWLTTNQTDIEKLDQEREGILKGIRFGLDIEAAWVPVYQLIETFAPYMERRGHWDEWREILKRAIELASQYGDDKALANLSAVYARLFSRQSYYQQSAKYYLQAIQLSRNVEDRYNEARSCTNLGHLYIVRGHWWRAEVLCKYALKHFENLDNAHGRAHTENHLGLLYTHQGLWDVALNHLQKACSIWDEMGDENGLIYGYNNLGKLLNDMEEHSITPPVSSVSYLKKSLNYAQTIGATVMMGSIYINLGIAYRLRQQLEDAEINFHHAEEISRRFSDVYNTAVILDNWGLLYMFKKEWKKSGEYLQQALDSWKELSNSYGEITTMIYLAKYELAQKNFKRTITYLNKIEIMFRNRGFSDQHYRRPLKQIEELRRNLKQHGY